MKRKWKKPLLILAVVGIVLAGGWFGLDLVSKATTSAVSVGVPDITALADGTYGGSHEMAPVKVSVEVTVKEGRIINVAIVKHFCGLGKKAETVTSRIMEEQSLQVDDVAGATMSSKAIRKAVEDALTGENPI